MIWETFKYLIMGAFIYGVGFLMGARWQRKQDSQE